MDSLTWQSWLTLAIVGGMFASLMLSRVRAEVAFLSAMALLFVCGILDVRGAFGGFSSESVVVVGVLYVVIAGLTYTGVLNLIVKHLMGVPRSLSGAMVRLMLPDAACCAAEQYDGGRLVYQCGEDMGQQATYLSVEAAYSA